MFYKGLSVPGINTVKEEVNEAILVRIDEIINTFLKRRVEDGNLADTYGDFHNAALYLYPQVRRGVIDPQLPTRITNRIKLRYKGVPFANLDVIQGKFEDEK